MRPEDIPQAVPERRPSAEEADRGGSVEDADDRDELRSDDDEDDADDFGKPLSDALVRDLTAHRTLGLRLALGEQPAVALIAITHALAAQTFYHSATELSCLEVRMSASPLTHHADGIGETAAARALEERRGAWAARIPQNSDDLWDFVAALDDEQRTSLLAHCIAGTACAVQQRWDAKRRSLALADTLAEAVSLDMATHWQPTVDSYLSRVTKAHIVQAVREGVSDQAAERITGLKKQPMAKAAAELLEGTAWLPQLLRTRASDAVVIKQQLEAA